MRHLFNRKEERALLAEVRAGQVHAFDRIVRVTRHALVTYATTITRSSEMAEDAVHDVYTTLLDGRRTWTIRGSLTGYLFRAVRNRALDLLRREHRNHTPRVTSAHQIAVATERRRHALNTPVHHVEAHELEETILAVIQDLPTRRRQVLLLMVVAGLDSATVCTMLHISASSVTTYLAEARRDLAGALTQRGIDLPAGMLEALLDRTPHTRPTRSYRTSIEITATISPERHTPTHPFSSVALIVHRDPKA